ncbi:hypothetical protein C8Q75DRAFT_471592 [Abortiporus biennis]|nr:hypothetical protein C8Q75DRAFT_471592 [Abortiporus biennis]
MVFQNAPSDSLPFGSCIWVTKMRPEIQKRFESSCHGTAALCSAIILIAMTKLAVREIQDSTTTFLNTMQHLGAQYPLFILIVNFIFYLFNDSKHANISTNTLLASLATITTCRFLLKLTVEEECSSNWQGFSESNESEQHSTSQDQKPGSGNSTDSNGTQVVINDHVGIHTQVRPKTSLQKSPLRALRIDCMQFDARRFPSIYSPTSASL